MDEIRLTCPACEVQYRLPEDAIPAAGREVECTACGHVWLAKPQLKPLSLGPGSTIGDDPVEPDEEPSAPRLNRPLPPNVLSILRDELEFERRARAGERPTEAPAEDAAAEPGDNWPATTLRAPAPEGAARVDPLLPRPERAPDLSADTKASVVPTPARPVAATAASAASYSDAADAKNGYRIGFALGVLGCAVLWALYMVVPGVDDTSGIGAILGDARTQIDAARVDLRRSVFGAD